MVLVVCAVLDAHVSVCPEYPFISDNTTLLVQDEAREIVFALDGEMEAALEAEMMARDGEGSSQGAACGFSDSSDED
jgi:hypothetical protein